MADGLQESLDRAAEAISQADALLITAGAGIGVDSGLPDFRGNEGFWRAYPPLKRLGISFYDMANPLWFKRDPELAWGFYGHRLGLYRSTQPHDGFQIISNWSGGYPTGWFVFTSNVDGQFQKAGFDGDRILECHGSIHHLQCLNHCGEITSADPFELRVDDGDFPRRASPALVSALRRSRPAQCAHVRGLRVAPGPNFRPGATIRVLDRRSRRRPPRHRRTRRRNRGSHRPRDLRSSSRGGRERR